MGKRIPGLEGFSTRSALHQHLPPVHAKITLLLMLYCDNKQYIRVFIVDLQGNGSQTWEPVEASVLSKEYVVKRTRGGQINTFQLPAIDIYLHHGVDVALWTGELCWVFHLWVILGIKFTYRCHLYQDDEPKIVPHVVFLVDMILGKSGGH